MPSVLSPEACSPPPLFTALVRRWHPISILLFHHLIMTSIKGSLDPGPRRADTTLALGPLNADKEHVWIIDSNTTNEEIQSQVFVLTLKLAKRPLHMTVSVTSNALASDPQMGFFFSLGRLFGHVQLLSTFCMTSDSVNCQVNTTNYDTLRNLWMIVLILHWSPTSLRFGICKLVDFFFFNTVRY